MIASLEKLPSWLLLLAVTLLLYLPGTATLPLMDRDEPRFARATVEMMERETWVVPYFNDAYRFDKPPLTYWWMRLHYAMGGVNELMARLHSVVAVWLTALLVVGIGTRLQDRRTGLVAGLVWLTMLQVLVHGRLCVADMPLVLCLTLMARALLELLWLEASGGRGGRWWWVLYGAAGLGFLAKGPLILLVPAVALGLARWWGRQALPWRRLHVLSGLGLALVIVAAWGIPALMQTEGLFWKVGMGDHVVKRGTEVLNGRRFIPGIYFLTALLSLYPWSGCALPVWRHLRAHWQQPGTVFLLAWLASPFLIFSCYATQLPHYVMPGFPAAAVLVARWLLAPGGVPQRTPGLLKGLALLLTLLGAGLVLCPLMMQVNDAVRLPLVHAGWMLLALGVLGGLTLPVLRLQNPVLPLLSGFLLLGITVHLLADALRRTGSTMTVVAACDDLSTDTACLGWDYTEPSLVFYTGRHWDFTGSAVIVERFLKEHPNALVTALEREWTLDGRIKAWRKGAAPDTPSRDFSAAVAAMRQRFPHLEARAVSGLNAARMSWVQVLVLRQHAPAAAHLAPNNTPAGTPDPAPAAVPASPEAPQTPSPK